jgi:hypothetical protein
MVRAQAVDAENFPDSVEQARLRNRRARERPLSIEGLPPVGRLPSILRHLAAGSPEGPACSGHSRGPSIFAGCRNSFLWAHV